MVEIERGVMFENDISLIILVDLLQYSNIMAEITSNYLPLFRNILIYVNSLMNVSLDISIFP